MATPPTSLQRGILLGMLLLIVGFLAPVHAQESDLTFERLSTEQGLSNYAVTSMLQDRSGFLWIGTQGGLNRYDGYHFKDFVSSEYVRTLYEDRLGTLWIGTLGKGLFAYDPTTERFTNYPKGGPDSLSHDEVHAIFEDQHGIVWVGTGGGGLNRLDRATGRFAPFLHDPNQPNSIASDTVWALHASDAEPDVLWIGTKHGLNKLTLSTEHITRDPFDSAPAAGRIHDHVQSIYTDRSGTLWIGTRNSGLYQVHPDTGIVNQYLYDPDDPTSLAGNFIHAIYEDEDDEGILWIGTNDGGLSRLDRATGQFSNYINDPGSPISLPNDQVHAILTDRSDVLWVGTWGGIGKHNPYRKNFELYTHQPANSNTLSNSWISSIDEGRDGVLWIGTLGGKLNKLDRSANRFTHYPTLPFSEVISICEDQAGSLWLGTRDNTLYRFDPNTGRYTEYPLDDTENEDDILLTIYEAPSEPGLLWIGTKMRGLYRFDVETGSVTASYQHDPDDSTSLSNNNAWPIYEDNEGVIWVGTLGGGLNRWNRETDTFTHFLYDADNSFSISHNRVFSINEDKEGTLWIGTFGGGLNRFDRTTERFTHYTEEEGLPHNQIIAILGDDEGNLWLSTNNGLSRFDPNTETFTNYDVSDGLQGTSFHAGASLKSASGELFFGGRYGLNGFRPDRIKNNPHAPPIVFTDFQLFNESEPFGASSSQLFNKTVPIGASLSVIESITLNNDQNFIAFEFAALDLTVPSKNQYEYRLVGLDDDWIKAQNRRYVSYPKLDPQRYTFRVRGSNNEGVWNEEGVSIDIIINPPWWRTNWAYVFYGLLFGLGVFTVDRVQRRRLIRKERERTLLRELKQAEQIKRMNVQLRTNEQQLEEQNTLLEQQKQHLLKLDAQKSHFFADISHEFRTPLTLILSPLQGALDGMYGPLSNRLHQQHTIMRRNGARLLRLINQLLDLAKLESGRMTLRAREADVVSFVRRIAGNFASRAESKNIVLQFDSSQETLMLYFEPDKLEKIITNLLSNAFKFTPEHGKVRISLAAESDDASDVVEIIVKDTGQGIPAEEQPYIFDRFHGGTGIGLALTKSLVELHRGMISVESDLGFGSTFTVRLPLGNAHLNPEDISDDEDEKLDEIDKILANEIDLDPSDYDEMDASAEPDLTAPTVLIVEDNPDMRIHLKSHLAALYRIELASDGVEGLEKARAIHPALVISDVMMPEMNGYDLCHALKTDDQLNDVPVILLTARVDEDSMLTGLKKGADAYILKPFNPDVLRAHVENLIEIRVILRDRFKVMLIGPSEIAVPSAEEAFLGQVRDVVESHMGERNFGVDWLADEIGYSKKQLNRRLKAATKLKLSASGFIRMMRLGRAAQLLEQRAGLVSEIAYRVGFKNADHFSKLFKEVYGYSPSEYPTKQDISPTI